MGSARSSFVAGTIFGIVVGLVVGHVLIWRPLASEKFAENLSASPQRNRTFSLPAQDSVSASVLSDGMNYDLGAKASPYFVESQSIQPARQKTENEPTPATQERNQTTPPFEHAIAIQTAEIERTQLVEEPAVITTDVPAAEPQPLDIDNATPISNLDEDQGSAVKTVIDIELGHLPASQREIWFESLRDMSVEDATGIIRMWKVIGGPIPGTGDELFTDHSLSTSPVSPLAPMKPPTETPPAGEAESAAENTATPPEQLSDDQPFAEVDRRLVERLSRTAIRDAIAVHQRNLLMEPLSGYQPSVSRFVEEFENGMAQIVGIDTRVQTTSPASMPRQTGHSLDLWISGPGYFVVKSSKGQTYLTRRGRFSLNSQRQICLIDGDEEYLLQPVIQVPDDQGAISIDLEGRVTCRHAGGSLAEMSSTENVAPDETSQPDDLVYSSTQEPSRTQEVGQLLIAPVLQHHRLSYFQNALLNYDVDLPVLQLAPGSNGCGSLQQGMLEGSNVDVAAENARIESLRGLEKVLNQIHKSPATPSAY